MEKNLKNSVYIYSDESLCYMPAAAAAKSLQLCPTLCDPIDSSPPGSSVCGILCAKILEWVAISFSIVIHLKHCKSTTLQLKKRREK